MRAHTVRGAFTQPLKLLPAAFHRLHICLFKHPLLGICLPYIAGRGWAWALWEATVPLPKGTKQGGSVKLVCKATDESYNTQPERAEPIWNLRGVNCNSWHAVSVKVE
jgi:hypothetical protein